MSSRAATKKSDLKMVSSKMIVEKSKLMMGSMSCKTTMSSSIVKQRRKRLTRPFVSHLQKQLRCLLTIFLLSQVYHSLAPSRYCHPKAMCPSLAPHRLRPPPQPTSKLARLYPHSAHLLYLLLRKQMGFILRHPRHFYPRRGPTQHPSPRNGHYFVSSPLIAGHLQSAL